MPNNKKETSNTLTISDAIDEDVLSKLKQAKKVLNEKEEKAAEEERLRKKKEREEREKNKSFAELLDEYGDLGSKF